MGSKDYKSSNGGDPSTLFGVTPQQSTIGLPSRPTFSLPILVSMGQKQMIEPIRPIVERLRPWRRLKPPPQMSTRVVNRSLPLERGSQG